MWIHERLPNSSPFGITLSPWRNSLPHRNPWLYDLYRSYRLGYRIHKYSIHLADIEVQTNRLSRMDWNRSIDTAKCQARFGDREQPFPEPV